jgi:hypothetical protein
VTEGQEFAVHEEPAWRDRANFLIHARLPRSGRPERFEQLWTRQLGGDSFEVCCIPFLAPGLALGDVVATSPADGMTYVVDRLVEPSGRQVLRAWFGRSSHPRDEVARALAALGSLTEWSPLGLLAVDAADGEHAQLVAGFLAERERAGQLTLQPGRAGP